MTSTETPLRHLLVYANPSPDSFDAAIRDAYVEAAGARGHEVIVRDLYAMGFDPVLKAEERPLHNPFTPAPDVAEELKLLTASDALVLIYPIWFGLPPAILKGYVDRVLGAGYSFREFREGVGQPALQGKPLLSFSTSGTPLSWLHERGQVLSLREIFDVYLWRGLGMRQSEHVMIDSVVPNMSTAYAAEQLERVRQAADRTCALIAADRHAGTAAAALGSRAG